MPREFEFNPDSELDVIQNQPVKDIVSHWKWIVDMRQKQGKPFSMFWVAGSEEKNSLAIDYIRKVLEIDSKAVIQLKIEPGDRNLRRKLESTFPHVQLNTQNKLLLIASGFEKAIKPVQDTYLLSRYGHDWDQDVLEQGYDPANWVGQLYVGINKQVVILTTIGHSSGDEVYEKAVRSALISQFKDGILELQ